jgi:two-component system, NtrC family, response regulator PilR
VESAVEAMRVGAFGYVTKPFEPSELVHRAQNALERHRLRREVHQLRKQIREDRGFGRIIGTSRSIQRLAGMVSRVAAAAATILIEGESGTGKELVTRVIHAESARASQPFVGINGAALPEAWLESELFGRVRGAFTGAVAAQKGLFEEAGQGTPFLDEIGDTPPPIQVRLLRVLQEREIRRVGSASPIRIDARLLAATNRPWKSWCAKGGSARTSTIG